MPSLGTIGCNIIKSNGLHVETQGLETRLNILHLVGCTNHNNITCIWFKHVYKVFMKHTCQIVHGNSLTTQMMNIKK